MERLYKISTIFPSNPATGKLGSIDANITLIRWSGIPLLDTKNASKISIALFTVYGLGVMSIVTFIYTGLELHDLVLSWDNLDDLTQNTCLSLSHISGAVKVINILNRRKDILRIIEQFKMLSRKYVISPKQKEAFYRDEFENKLPLLIYFGIVIITGITANSTLIVNPTNIAGKVFPFRVKMPEFLPSNVQLMYMVVGISLHGLQITGVDCLNVALINQTRHQMKILNIAFEKLAAPATTIDANKYLNRLFEHHNLILKIRRDIENIFNYPLLLQFFTSLLVVAITGFQATVQSDSSRATLIYFYCGGIFFQLFAYCWFGNEVSEQNKTLASRGFNTNWYNFDQRYKSSLIIFLMNAQRPLNFTAGGFVELSLSTFSGILSKSYSYIAFLRQIYVNK